ncbi:glycosyltransferase [Chloroflexi bacterium TSY]|nr:glycosyltransferase [Chloroflexi bacterium TSY]
MYSKARILHLTASLRVGGAERLLLHLAEQTNRQEFDVHICSIGEFGEHSLMGEFKKLNLPLHVIPAKHFYTTRPLWAIIDYIRSNQIDCLQTHLIDADILGTIAGWFTSTPVISTLQNVPQNYARQRFDRSTLMRLATHYGAAHLVAVSRHVQRLFIDEWRIPEQRIQVIHNAVQLAPFLNISEPSLSSKNGPLTITNIASLTPQKGQHLLLKAAKQILGQRSDVHFIFVGRGKLRQSLETQAAELGIAEHVTFAGLRSDISNILAATDIFVLSSLWEGLPLSAIEAMGAARPVVLTDVGGNRELVVSDKHGVMVPAGQVPPLANALLDLLERPEQRLALGKTGRDYVKQNFGIQTITKRYEELYRRILGKDFKYQQDVELLSSQSGN